MFSNLEDRLAASPLDLAFEISAEGAVEADLRGRLLLAEEVELRAEGSFAGAPAQVHLWTEGDRLNAGPEGSPRSVPRPGTLVPALVVGLTRMGLLHNLAVLIAGAPPDHAEGGVESWVQTVDHRFASEIDREGIVFGLVVDGQPSGQATLWLDEGGLPRRREQTVDFPEGQMRVVERYEPGASR